MTARSPSFNDSDGQPNIEGMPLSHPLVPQKGLVLLFREINLLDRFNEIKSIVLPNNLSR